MKKLMVMFLGVAFAACAWAGDTPSFITKYSADTNPSIANVSWYSCYFMTVDAITTATGGLVASVDAAAYTAWLQSNFADNKAATVSSASFTIPNADSYFKDDGQYRLLAIDSPDLYVPTEYLAVCFFDNQTDSAFQIIEQFSTAYWVDDYEVSNWIAAPASSGTNVPEPTSGLMLLLGLAGLALKRKAV